MVSDTETQQGVFVTGELIRVEDPEEYTVRGTGERKLSYAKVKLLVGDSVLNVEYPKVADMPAFLADAVKGDSVTLGVIVRGTWDPESKRRGAVGYNGVRVGE